MSRARAATSSAPGIGMLAYHTELFKQFSDNPSFKRWLADRIFSVTYDDNAA